MNLVWHPIGLTHWLLLCTALFSIGLYGVLVRRNAIGILLAVEVMLNSAAVLVVAMFHYLHPGVLDGMLSALFFIAGAAAEVVLAMAIYIPLVKRSETSDVTQLRQLQG